jgi:acyl carrier protein
MDSLEQQIFGFYARAYNKEASTLKRETNIAEELSSKSMMVVAVVASLENELDVIIPLAEASKIKTIGEMIDRVKKELGA